MCNLSANHKSGIVTIARKNLRCDAIIKYCTISTNKEYGIVVTGAQNFTRIEKNINIEKNTKAGIQVENDAQVTIVYNKISQNFG